MNTKNFRSMQIMHELPTNKANFLIKTTQDFNSSRHAAPHLPIVFTDNIILYFNLIPFVLHVFKRSCNAHITFIFGHFTVYAYRTLEFFLQKKPLNFYFTTRNHFRDEIIRHVINIGLITTLKKCWYVQNNWVLLIYAFCILQLKVLWKFHYAFFGRWFCSWCAIFKMAASSEHCKMQVLISFYFTRITEC